MSQAPMMPVFVDALISDTLELTSEEFGAYLLLLFATWRNNGNPLPDDPRKLARICRCSTTRWNRVLRPSLIGFFRRDDDGFLHQKRLEKEWAFCANTRAKNMQKKSPTNSDNLLETLKTTPSARARARPTLTLTLVEKEDLAPKELNLSFSTARDATPPLPSQGDGVAASRAPLPEAESAAPTVFDDPALKAEAIAMLGQCLDAVRGKRGTLDSQAAIPPPDPALLAFRARLQRLNALAGRHLDGEARMQAWEIIGQADSLGDPVALPPPMVADLAAIESLQAYAEAAE